eukprot:TRINITY_DN104034_c0_g1_i1.p1 TRINITY_DN104034_c0_g1~~TRINITY_DN104034_c0_g1_i1.p1  ORF type:complete len:691 (+),score=115.86 TRINITY_DN104034_c0_g1_i1:34-2073(+)
MGQAICTEHGKGMPDDGEPVNVNFDVHDAAILDEEVSEPDDFPAYPSRKVTDELDALNLESILESVVEDFDSPPVDATIQFEPTRIRRCFSAPAEFERAFELPIEVRLRREFSDVTAGWVTREQGYELHSLAPPGRAIWLCKNCGTEGEDLFTDVNDLQRYCAACWAEFNGRPPEVLPLVRIEAFDVLSKDHLDRLWEEAPLPGWPLQPGDEVLGPPLPKPLPSAAKSTDKDAWNSINVCVRRKLVGSQSRQQHQSQWELVGETLAGRYKLSQRLGEGNFTKAFLAKDLKKGDMVCVKCYHRQCTVDELVDLMVLTKRLNDADPAMETFPHVRDAFFDIAGFTVETLISGQHCFGIAADAPEFFADLQNLAHVARGVLKGLALLEQAGIVHNDLKPDNILWVSSPSVGDGSAKDRGTSSGTPSVRIVDFGCARLDQREDPEQNWNLAEGGAGHLGYASPEMNLGMPITHVSDIWSLGVLLCELHSCRGTWYSDTLSPEEVMTQALGLAGLSEGVPSSLLRRAPIDVQRFYTPAFLYSRGHMPVLRKPEGSVEVLRPMETGLEQILGANWQAAGKAPLQELLARALQLDHLRRSSAAQLLQSCSFVSAPAAARASPSRRMWSNPFTWGRKLVPQPQPPPSSSTPRMAPAAAKRREDRAPAVKPKRPSEISVTSAGSKDKK